MTYAVKIDGNWIEKTPRQFRAERNASIPQAKLAEEGLHEVTVDPKPDAPGKVVEPGPLVDRNGLPYRTCIVRDKTQAEIDAERDRMGTSRARFALAAYTAGIITEAEAEAWAGGNSLPQVVTDTFNANIADATERLAARIEALTTRNIHRTNPFILMLQANLGLTDDQTDGLFQ